MFTQLSFEPQNRKPSTAYEWQARALEVWQALHAPLSKKSEFIRLCKRDRIKFESAFRFVKERKLKDPATYFLWLITH